MEKEEPPSRMRYKNFKNDLSFKQIGALILFNNAWLTERRILYSLLFWCQIINKTNLKTEEN